MDFEPVIAALQAAFPDVDLAPRAAPLDDTFVTIPAEGLRRAVTLLLEDWQLRHLSTITGLDTGEYVELLYHFWHTHGLTLRVTLPYAALRIASITDLIPGAAFYEREIVEMFAVTVDGLPDPRPFLLPDDWDGGAPLRKGV
ncbi:MAG TPA: NADH-quinone oxidoreductase subunit C [Anaerolineae bacterium]|nr:NADH-quinone oxidoreductase subunit C [Anaerolineae bacterium]HPD40604.1 NADH-quinone oxidoreductase subunit C [Anaerolineae bacterium]HRT31151.1 NADH-quinone oxidoreductase subunit C [Anaerolineae bacterium]HRU94211.1 NADH-quinone oxidoreductase subunit C [Anaerolineae bacterium]HXK43368.1 NADH-quinone oxidoreductase subunit C [Anaerolineae bacterium]